MTLADTLRTLFTPTALGLEAPDFKARLEDTLSEAERRSTNPDAQEQWALYRLYGQQLAHLTQQAETVSSEGEGSRTQGLGTRIAAIERARDSARAEYDRLTAVTTSTPARRASGSVRMVVEP